MKWFPLLASLSLALVITIKAGTTPEAAPFADVNLAAADMGGDVEELTDMYGPGLTGRRLIDGLLTPTWRATSPVTYPHEATISFYEREPALVQGVAIDLPPNAALAPKDVEIWTSTDLAPEKFVKAAAQTLKAQSGTQVMSFSPIEARFIKLRVLSGFSPAGLEIAEVRVLEGERAGYTPLFTRQPGAAQWKGSPREAAQRGLEWLQTSSAAWTTEHNCYGCHVQAQALMGQAVALREGYRVSMSSLHMMIDKINQSEYEGAYAGDSAPSVVFAMMANTYINDVDHVTDSARLVRGLDFLMKRDMPEGAFPVEDDKPPIIQGRFMTNANLILALDWAAAHGAEAKYKATADRAVAWIETHQPETTQDHVFKILALVHRGSAKQKQMAWSIVERLVEQQQADGGWKEISSMEGSNAFATGEVLYAFKQAGVSITSPPFQRAVSYLLKHQVGGTTPDSGSWKAENTQSEFQTDFAPSMWAVIGLAGSFGRSSNGSLQVSMRVHGERPPARNVEIVLDVSGSMNTPLGTGTRWSTALDVLKQTLAKLPDDLNVGMRVYGHRYPPKSKETCTDSELVVPIGPLDRARVLSVASMLKPRGDTPLVRSVLATIDDLREVHGGSVLLITDGEESCQGDPRAAAAQLKASGLDVTLNIVGFTITGQTVQAELGALAQSTGGRYYGAQDRAQLARALTVASLQRLPYDVLDAAGHVVASGQTSELGRELPPGSYRIRIDALGQPLVAPITIARDRTTNVVIAMNGSQFVIRHD